ncbi:hypothetical protein TUM12370_29100 [Salmonella enterica subsp. enterica serovar Choleraesuis]|nr:hypothetical protein TUM12370_29100 [Salmonella enterica subsp. enterica serovar Choleraesuis]
MKLAITMAVAASLLTMGVAQAETAQQHRMTTCNQQAKTQSLKGDQRKAFMSSCLKKDAAATHEGKTLTPQQQKMKTCNADAAKQSLKGDARKSFMSSCLKKS